jgi:hypothetical protein
MMAVPARPVHAAFSQLLAVDGDTDVAALASNLISHGLPRLSRMVLGLPGPGGPITCSGFWDGGRQHWRVIRL